MALVPHGSSSDQNDKAVVAVRGAQELTQEEYDKRIKDVSQLLGPLFAFSRQTVRGEVAFGLLAQADLGK